MSLMTLARRGRAIALIAGALLLVPIVAEAAPGGRSFGSRGSRSQSQVAPTPTAPGSSFQRNQTQAPGPSAATPAAGAAAGAAAQAAKPSFARSLMMGVAGGLLGAGLFGLLSGAGFGGLAGFLGLLFQVALIGGLIWLALRLFRRRSEPQLASAGAPLGRQAYQPQAAPAMAGLGGGAAAAAKPVEFELAGSDYGAFERLLGEVQAAISNEDVARLRQITTPEISGALEDEFAENARKGLIERAAEVKLLQGDLAESWREDGYEYATVAMRFSLLTAMVERNGGRVVEGHATIPREATEHWTFVRPRGGEWKVAAIQPVE
jgi:predicted lipid-binding transport protein (Tim44 family)